MEGKEDAKKPSVKAHAFYREKVDLDQLPPDYVALLSLIFGIMGLMLKVRKRCLCACVRNAGAWLHSFCV
jgi:hypothetical protein